MEQAISSILFYAFACLAILAAFGVVVFRNPVNSALSMAVCFAFCAAILFGMGAQFLGIVQITVYAGAILVLFLFVVMMLDIKKEEKTEGSKIRPIIGMAVAALFGGMVGGVALALPGATEGQCPAKVICNTLFCSEETEAATPQKPSYGGALPTLDPAVKDDVKLLGNTLFSKYPIAFAILSFALLSGCVGSIAISRKLRKN